jgi:hypothetical protein
MDPMYAMIQTGIVVAGGAVLLASSLFIVSFYDNNNDVFLVRCGSFRASGGYSGRTVCSKWSYGDACKSIELRINEGTCGPAWAAFGKDFEYYAEITDLVMAVEAALILAGLVLCWIATYAPIGKQNVSGVLRTTHILYGITYALSLFMLDQAFRAMDESRRPGNANSRQSAYLDMGLLAAVGIPLGQMVRCESRGCPDRMWPRYCL